VSDRPASDGSDSAATGPVAWLVVAAAASQARLQADDVPPAPARLPLSRASCVALARLVLAGQHSQPAGVASAFRLRGGNDPRVEAWLVDASGDLSRGVLTALESLLVIRDPAAAEAALLAEAVATIAAHRRDFDRQVAAARLEAMREFAYGAGHELNNPLANIATRAQALLLDEPDPERRRRLATIVDQAFRGRDMIGGLMVFARPPLPRPERVSLDGLVRDVVAAVRSLAESRSTRLSYQAPAGPLEAFVDVAHVSEALRLLIMNAVEAAAGVSVTCGGATGGCLVTLDDDGPGMDAAMLQRAFDPFSSGREAGRGIGLGLPKAWRLLESNGCRLDVRPRAGRGLSVSLWLPAAITPADGSHRDARKPFPDSQLAGFQAAKESSPTA